MKLNEHDLKGFKLHTVVFESQPTWTVPLDPNELKNKVGKDCAVTATDFEFTLIFSNMDVMEVLEFPVCIPKGFVFNGASIPKMIQPLVGNPFTPSYIIAALIHDWFYQKGDDALPRKFADEVFRELLQLYSDNSNLFHFAVRMGGWASYDDYDNDGVVEIDSQFPLVYDLTSDDEWFDET